MMRTSLPRLSEAAWRSDPNTVEVQGARETVEIMVVVQNTEAMLRSDSSNQSVTSLHAMQGWITDGGCSCQRASSAPTAALDAVLVIRSVSIRSIITSMR